MSWVVALIVISVFVGVSAILVGLYHLNKWDNKRQWKEVMEYFKFGSSNKPV